MSLIQDTALALDSLGQAAQQPIQMATQEETNLIQLLMKGGWIMWPIAFLFFLGLVIFLERYITIRKASKFDNGLMSQIKSNVMSGKLDAAVAVCRSSNTPLSRMLQKGLLRVGRPIKDIEGAIENIGKIEVSKLEKNINILGIIAGIAPMLGFVGTIFGVIQIFRDVEAVGGIDIGSVSGGLYVKMISSASGLTVGILAYIGYHALNMMVERLILRMETDAVEFIDLLDEPGA
ncbi:transporter, MotA/TolQ/ExbB proton channel family protein [Sphingobacterium spiritivorum ATCC 33300]|uniref:Transporter, MotA/TolQ/ExbB proton channel family protein n=3 Tax=Sphingobacterium spiritivorum TaxID=258 RepID=D7VJ78_SPHSI|nr:MULTISPECIES: MotA/TolQ/ExbB proton channel family protein [Sphingobacterium]EEI92719.1 transporter, MotA/TolQ/ExbB proton channel family protein [Sphingobacterium spiritivorum ATCC 33300]EFK58931.1 transporter, MotA/TolQ/ExbB proton channel family protein [Sphingobacterium spiritivorum ATCC 33861]QQS94221.1 MotA/TolQ/ExbB proton channel family protein [Sphingobacterium spiritivorum]QQT27046.1 MotA/TolQ/ExbB proton channel family protein [Sphingobacterium spiritivorum]QQT36793.1 MotA/TolQ/E